MENGKTWQFFVITPGTLNFDNLKAFMRIMKFNPEVKKLFPKGFILAEPIDNNTGGILYPKDTELNAERVERLQQLKEKKPDYSFEIILKKGKKVADYFRNHIKKDFNKLIKSKKNKNEFRTSIGGLEKILELYLDDILKDDELIYLLFHGRSIDEYTSKSGIPRYFYHSINVSIFALEIMQNALMTIGIRFNKPDLINIATLGLLHDMGAIENVGKYTKLPVEKQKEYYLQEAAQSFMAAKKINLDNDFIQALKKFGAYHRGDKEVVIKKKEEEDLDVKYANILITADVMDHMVSGLFGDPVPVKAAMDQLYVMANNKELRKGFVDTLAKGLKLDDLFDFYHELERLKKMCLFKKYARPYPMLGFKSPVLVLCGGKRNDCPEHAKSLKAVRLFKPSSNLEPGAYGRCNLLSSELMKFYESYYDDIKESTMLKVEEDKQKDKESKSNESVKNN
ncbi:HD domain-containing protein [candidate division KSB1 bacterium]